MPSLIKTSLLVKAALSGQKDKAGVSKYEHCHRVASNALKLMNRYNLSGNDYVLVAFLHDIIEDSDITEQDLHLFGFNNSVIDAVVMLTHDENSGMSYSEYVDNICANGSLKALIGKLADNMDNTDPDRCKYLDEKFMQHLNARYFGVREKLETAINERLKNGI